MGKWSLKGCFPQNDSDNRWAAASDTDYEIMLVRANEASEPVTFHTEPEPNHIKRQRFLAHLVMAFMTTQAQFRQLFFVALRMQSFDSKGRTYPVTALFLKSDMILELQENAVLAGIYDRARTPILPGQIEYDNEDGYYNLGSWEGNPY